MIRTVTLIACALPFAYLASTPASAQRALVAWGGDYDGQLSVPNEE